MRSALLVLLSALLFSVGFAQGPELPKPLRLQGKAAGMTDGFAAETFKLLPRGMFEDKSGRDEDNPIGIRGGGAYYSFTNRSHSYNKTPQIEFQGGNLMVGFAGADYGLIRDLGTGSLADVSAESEDLAFLVEYKQPVLLDEIRLEQKKSNNYQVKSDTYARRVPAVVGHVYALRAISFDEADILVALKILGTEKDGSLIIGWKALKQFEVPKVQDR